MTILPRVLRLPGPMDAQMGMTGRMRRRLAVLVAVVLVWTGGSVAHASAAHASVAAADHPTHWVSPVPLPTVVRAFDPPEQDWHAGHRGVDLSALPGEPLRAPAHATVRFAGTVASKPVVSLEIDGWVMSMENVDAAVAKGDEVFAGHTVGHVATPAHCAEGCVHVGVRPVTQETDYRDPLPFFSRGDVILLPQSQAPDEMPPMPEDDGRSGAGAWGGHSNGRIPAVALCPLQSAPGQLLRCDASRAFEELNAAFRQRFGHAISVTDAYRDYETQVILKRRKGRMAATPGTSTHGWGLAVDLGSGINRFGTPAHTWMRENAPRFGWVHPAWARQSGSLPEAWHWEYAGG